MCTDALSGETNRWRWIEAAPHVDLNQASDCKADDIQGWDALAAAADVDA